MWQILLLIRRNDSIWIRGVMEEEILEGEISSATSSPELTMSTWESFPDGNAELRPPVTE